MDMEDYQYAFISGPNHNYLWLLSRTPMIKNELCNHFIDTAKTLGFDTQELIFVEH